MNSQGDVLLLEEGFWQQFSVGLPSPGHFVVFTSRVNPAIRINARHKANKALNVINSFLFCIAVVFR